MPLYLPPGVSAHQTTHQAGGSDALPWTTINGSGTSASRPAAASTNAGYTYFSTDTGDLSRSNGSSWSTIGQVGANLPRFGRATSFGHSYTQTAGNKGGTNNGIDLWNNFAHRVAAFLNISSDEVFLQGKSGGMMIAADTGENDQQGWGVIQKFIFPNHWFSRGQTGTAAKLSQSKGWPGVVLLTYGTNEPVRLFPTAINRSLEAFIDNYRSCISRIRAGRLYDSSDTSTIGKSGFAATALTDDVNGVYSKGTALKSTTNGDTFTITLPSDFTGGDVAVRLMGSHNTWSAAATISSTSTTAITLTDPFSLGTHTAIENGNVIVIDSEQMLVTAGGGTLNLTVTRGVNGTTPATHANGANVYIAKTTANVAWSGTATGATGTTYVNGAGIGVSATKKCKGFVTKRFTGLTASDAGKTIIGTVGGITASSNEFVGFDGWHQEDPDSALILCVATPSIPNSFWDKSTADVYHTYLNLLCAEFSGGVAMVDTAGPMHQRFYLTMQANCTNVATTLHFTPNDSTVGELKKGAVVAVGSEQIQLTSDVTKTSSTDWNATCTRGFNGTTAAAHTAGDGVWDMAWISADNVHPSDYGHGELAAYIIASIAAASQTTRQRALAGGLVVRTRPKTPITGAQWLGPGFTARGTQAGAAIGKAWWNPIFIPEMGVITAFGCEVTALPTGTAFARFGLWTDLGAPNDLIIDSGQLGLASSAFLSIPAYQPILPGWYWLGMALQGSGTMPTIRTSVTGSGQANDYNIPWLSAGAATTPGGGSPPNGLTGTGFTGAFGDVPASLSTNTTQCALAFVQLATPSKSGG